MSKGNTNLILESVLTCGAMAGVYCLVRTITGKPFNLPLLAVMMVSAVAGLFIANRRVRKG